MKKTRTSRLKRGVILGLLSALLLLILTGGAGRFSARADTADDAREALDNSVEEILGNLDLSGLESYYNTLDREQQDFFGAGLYDYLKRIVTGENEFDFSGFAAYLFSVLGRSILNILPMVMSIVAIAVVLSIVGGVRGSFASSSIETVVGFAGVGLVAVIVLAPTLTAVTAAGRLVGSLKMQMESIFPALFTLMTAVGASGSVKVYQPAVAALSVSLSGLITTVILPIILITAAFAVIGNLSGAVKLTGMTKFLGALCKWILYTSFFLFIGFLSVQGITASVYDNISVRTAKFALSQYVPVIGGYLSEGFNIIAAGSVLVKNAVGLTSILLMLLTVLPVLIEVILLALGIRLAAALIEPFASERIGGLLNALASAVNMLISVIAGILFLYGIFMILIIASGNLAL
ncbi:MAG: stage III sporulation protein AE [Clostridiales bacterium]|nr:stage III sporulation protein AE [Clostridiales bacterium]